MKVVGAEAQEGKTITQAYIRNTRCPLHGNSCYINGSFCRSRVERAIHRWHNELLRKRKCSDCQADRPHVHLGWPAS